MEESVLVTIELWEGPAKAEYPVNERRRFSPTSLARFRDPDWPFVIEHVPITQTELLDYLAREVEALRAHALDVLAGETSGLHAFLAALDEWHRGPMVSPFPPR